MSKRGGGGSTRGSSQRASKQGRGTNLAGCRISVSRVPALGVKDAAEPLVQWSEENRKACPRPSSAPRRPLHRKQVCGLAGRRQYA